MGFLTSRRSQQSAATLPQYTGLQLQTASNALPIPIVYGMQKVGANVLSYSEFTPEPVYQPQQSAGKGGAFGGGGGGGGITWQQTGWKYRATLQLGLCEGPISAIGQVWSGQSIYRYADDSPNPNGFTLSTWEQDTSLFIGTATQSPWGYFPASGPSTLGYDLAYHFTVHVDGAKFDLGESASIGTLNFEVAGLLYGTGVNGVDADCALVIQDFLTDANHGAGFPAARLDLSWLLGGDGTSSVQCYCTALGICFSPKIDQTEDAASILTRWLQIMNCAAVRSSGMLRFIPYGDMNIQGNGVTWVAPVTSAYALDDDDFIAAGEEDPVRVTAADPISLVNIVRVEVLNRAGVNVEQALITRQQSETLAIMEAIAGRGASPGSVTLPQPQGQPQYQATPIEARDLASIRALGRPRVGQTITMHEICDLNVGATVAQIVLQRGLYVRRVYAFSLSWLFCLLDPMDIVELEDAVLGSKTVRILQIEEDDSGLLAYVAEELTVGVSTPGPNVASGTIVSGSNVAVATLPVHAVLIYEPPSNLTLGRPQIWFGAVGGDGTVVDPRWGGAFVWASVDGGVTYNQVSRINGPMKRGVLTANLVSAVGFDITNTLSVDMTLSGAQLTSTTDANAQAGIVNLSLVNDELIDFATSVLTSTNHYDLSRIARGLYGTATSAHPVGSNFTHLDQMAKNDLPQQFIGVDVKFKFQSFNIYGFAVEDLATCAVYSYSPHGSVTWDSTSVTFDNTNATFDKN